VFKERAVTPGEKLG